MTGPKKICIHGHFYQPPRIDPWLREVLPEGSAAPGVNWNQRILAASYAPLAWARRRDGHGLITDMVNCYEWISFNCGPTLLSWLETADPVCYARILEADRQSVCRWGHGNAMAQCHHHMIMPLASSLDQEVQLAWAKADFQTRFGRDPEGLWLPEAAVDTVTLEAVVQTGFRFVVLAPRQAAAVADLDGDNRIEVNESSLDIHSPYTVLLPSGRNMSVFFYHGPLSRAVAFERLLENGEQFWQRLAKAARPGLLSLATDGETYGHHFPFGEMALAYALEQAKQGRDGLELTNYAVYLAENPPTRQVFLHEPSSWSCVHGVERWRADCGCTDGGHPGWNQRWRTPLRHALEVCKARIDDHYFASGGQFFKDPHKALLEYGRLLADGMDTQHFVRDYFQPGLSPLRRQQGFNLLTMQEWAMCSLASCAWFFDEISRVEPLNAMTYALRAMELARATGAEDFAPDFLRIIAQAQSNLPDKGSGADLWDSHVLPRSMNLGAWTLLGLLLLRAQDRLEESKELTVAWPDTQLALFIEKSTATERLGKGRLHHLRNDQGKAFHWRWEEGPLNRPWSDTIYVRPSANERGEVSEIVFTAKDLAWNRKELIVLSWLEQQDRQWWKIQRAFGARALGHFLKWQEDQDGQNQEPLWRAHLPGLVWSFVLGSQPLQEPDEFLYFVRRHWQPLEVFNARLNEHLLTMLAEKKPDWPFLGRIMDRIRALGVSINLWAVENRLWEMGLKRPEVRDLAGRLWFRC
ncbi:MAG TPA: DUF3536 domain-containing protein [Desulfonatronum sp.]|nr:DUF3536 domain-containing protein [Desulfonatronum sp.]